ncbi:MAG: hypothetical protein NTW26_11585 [bacterium]|nr:hypothetical protein [bacterium]
MTRTITFLLCALTFSATLGLADDDLEVLWEEPYDLVRMNGGFGIYGEFYTQDDFTLETDAVLEAVECWAYYYFPDDDYHPQPFNVTIRYDHYGMPGGYYITTRTFDVEETDTGDDYHEYRVWHYRLNIDPRHVDGGTRFWLEIRTDARNCKWACKDVGNLYFQWNQWDKAAFFHLLGTPEDTRVQPASWGEIKAGFSD